MNTCVKFRDNQIRNKNLSNLSNSMLTSFLTAEGKTRAHTRDDVCEVS